MARLELESPICSGSVKYQEGTEGVYIEGQTVVDPANNDFSKDSWEVPEAQ